MTDDVRETNTDSPGDDAFVQSTLDNEAVNRALKMRQSNRHVPHDEQAHQEYLAGTEQAFLNNIKLMASA